MSEKECVYTPVLCEIGEECDPIDGLCHNTTTTSPPNYSNTLGSQFEFSDEGISATIPPMFFEVDAAVNVVKTNAHDQLFAESAMAYDPISNLSYTLQFTSDVQPATKEYAEVIFDVPSDFTSTLSDTENIGVFLRMLQSSDSSGTFPAFALASSKYDDETGKLQFWLPSYAFISNGDSYEAVIAVATRKGPESASSNTRHLLSQPTARCEAVSIHCPLGIGECGDDKVLSPFSIKRKAVVNGIEVISPHWGVDYYAELGDGVYAAADGVIEHAEYLSYGFGEGIVLRHADGSATVYAHLLEDGSSLGEGFDVLAGEQIGRVGHSGSALVAHLHFEYIPSGSIYISGFKIDPHPCTQSVSKGSISIGDSGSAADDIFAVYVDGVYLGKTEKGETNNIAVNGYLPGEHSLKVHVHDDGGDVGTFEVELFDGLRFEDGSTIKEYTEFDRISEGESINFIFLVPEVLDNDKSYDCDDGISKGTCLTSTSSCDSQWQYLLPAKSGQCENLGVSPQCCYSTPKCYKLNGECMPTSDCGSSNHAVSLKCPGPSDVQCCIPNDTCAQIGGECRNACNTDEFETHATCSESSSKCCAPSPACVGIGEFSHIRGYCAKKSQCTGNDIPAGRGIDCGLGADDVECCIPSPSCKFFANGVLHNGGTCRTECIAPENEYVAQDLNPMQCEKCCAFDPYGPDIPVPTRTESLTFESTLIDDTFVDEVVVRHKVELEVDWVKINGNIVSPRLITANGQVTEQDFDKTEDPVIKSQRINNGYDLSVLDR